jgi:chromosome segregation protein
MRGPTASRSERDRATPGRPTVSRLRELRLHGFKTFADATRFVFQPGVNAVIGPNGSGKSNMADAVRWVLGEQSNRSLRTRRADDVIFAGSQQRRPTGMAEVTLTLDNEDGWLPIAFAEVTIGRRSYRSGENEYLINGARARLRDIVELLGAGQLGANSLVVVGQGTVDAALSLRPEERRQLFEEAAGVKNLQVRKNEALSRLARADDNLTRVADLVGELRPQVRRLALQAKHQQEHDALRTRGRALVAVSHRRRERVLREALGDARRRAAAAEAAAETFRAEQTAARAALEGAETRYWEADASARSAADEREQTREALIRAESRHDALRARHVELQATAERSARDLAETIAALEAPVEVLEPQAEQVLAAASDAERVWQGALARLAAADRELLDAEEQLAAARRRDADLIASEARRAEASAAARARVERLESERGSTELALSSLRKAIEPLREAATEREAQARAARAEAEAARTLMEETRRLADEARREATTAAERAAAAQAEIDALDERATLGARLGHRLVTEGWASLLDTLTAPDSAWAAIEAVVGGEVGDALLWRDASPVDATRDARGTARLLDGRSGPTAAERREALAAVGARRTLAEWIGSSDAPALFSRVAVSPDLDTLLAGWRSLPAGWCAVTEAGDLADGRGILALRGRGDPPGGAAARQQARRRDLAAQLADLERTHSTHTDAAARAVAEAAARQRRHAELRDLADAQETDGRRAAGELAEAEARLSRAERQMAELGPALDAAREAVSEHAAPDPDHGAIDHEALHSRVSEARAVGAEAAADRDQARAGWQAARARADALEQTMLGTRRRKAELEARRTQVGETREAAAAAIERIATELTAVAADVDRARQADSAAAEQRRIADGAREELRATLLQLERDQSGAGGRLAELDREAQGAAVEASRHEEALAALAREREMALDAFSQASVEDGDEGGMDAVPGADLEAIPTELVAEAEALDDATLEAEQRRVRRTLAQIGSVNPFAVEEHEELSTRLDELSGQEGDLRAAIESTTELIARLDREIAERFGSAFDAIGQKFDEFVRLLFAGGSAALQLGDAEDGEAPGGIEIVVRPPGKRLQRLAMLSGGERALTGVALLFAMLSVNPVPFCILDEVDAALDEANIGRFAEALRHLAEQIDFVVITHNRATIEVADTIYGVTMTDAAVSRVLSLRLSDLPVEVGA